MFLWLFVWMGLDIKRTKEKVTIATGLSQNIDHKRD